jgi:hypothetical protein
MSPTHVYGCRVYVLKAGKMRPNSPVRGCDRVFVEGFTLADGRPIRFRSVFHAARHIENVAPATTYAFAEGLRVRQPKFTFAEGQPNA